MLENLRSLLRQAQKAIVEEEPEGGVVPGAPGTAPEATEAVTLHEKLLDEVFKAEYELSRAEERMRRFMHVAQQMTATSTRDIGKLLSIIVQEVTHITNADQSFLLLLKRDELSIQASYSASGDAPQESFVSMTIVRKVIDTGEPLLIHDAPAEADYYSSETLPKIGSLMCASLKTRGRVLGALYVFSRTRTNLFTQGDLDLLRAFASQAAIALENARMYLDLRETRREALELAKLRQRLIENITQELRTPLWIISGGLDVLDKAMKNPTEMEASTLADIKRGTRYLDKVTSSLIDYVAIEERLGKKQRRRVPVQNIIDLENWKSQADQKGVSLSMLGSVEGYIEGDEELLIHAVDSVLGNAVMYTRQGDEIKVAVKSENNAVGIIVIDNGIGIPEDDLPHVWEWFFRASNVRALAPYLGGIGTGLKVARRIIEDHGGKIDLKSSERGTVVTIILPLSA